MLLPIFYASILNSIFGIIVQKIGKRKMQKNAQRIKIQHVLFRQWMLRIRRFYEKLELTLYKSDEILHKKNKSGRSQLSFI